jgi:hypothetical protein
MIANAWQFLLGTIAQWAAKQMPRWALRWQNKVLFESPWSRAVRALVAMTLTMLLLILVGYGIGTFAPMQLPSAKWKQHQENTRRLSQQLNLQKSQLTVAQTQLNVNHHLLEAQQIELDELTVAWPNSNFQLSMLNRLQQMAQRRGLQVLDLKVSPESPLQGYETSTLRFNVKGSEGAVQAYWQVLNQLFQNGLWVTWVFRSLPNGLISLEGQLQLLWDADDAFTDTGVEQLHLALTGSETGRTSLNPRKTDEDLAPALPDQSPQSMQVVGSARPSGAAENIAAWTWIRSGTQVHLVQSGQRVGLERLRVGQVDDRGLWLLNESGQSETKLAWELVKP